MAAEISIYCNACAAIGDAGKSHAKVRAGLRALGWLCRRGFDLCPPCREAREARLAEERERFGEYY